MSHRAIVAVQVGADQYDLHYSANGAEDLQLTTTLKDNLSRTGLDIQGVASSGGAGNRQVDKWANADTPDSQEKQYKSPNANPPPMEPSPMASGLSLSEVGYPVAFDTIEAFYLVRNGQVSTYVPVWMEANVIRPWREELEVEVYNSGKLTSSVDDVFDEIMEAEPVRVIGEEALAPGHNWSKDTIISDVVTRSHEYIYALQRQFEKSMREARAESDLPDIPNGFEAESLLDTGSRYLLVRGPSESVTPNPSGRGLFLQIPNHDTSKYWSVVDDANEARVEEGARLNVPESLDDEEEMESISALAKSLMTEYHESVAPFSPPPFGPLAEKLAGVLADR